MPVAPAAPTPSNGAPPVIQAPPPEEGGQGNGETGTPAIVPTPRGERIPGALTSRPQTYERNEAKALQLRRDGREKALARLQESNKAAAEEMGNVDDGQPHELPRAPRSEVAPAEKPAPAEPKDPPEKKPEGYVESGMQALMRKEAEVRELLKQAETSKADIERAQRIQKAREAGDMKSLFRELKLDPNATARFILEKGEELATPDEPAGPPDPRDEKLSSLEREVLELRGVRQKQQFEEARTTVKTHLDNQKEAFELVSALEGHDKALSYLQDFAAKHNALPGDGTEEGGIRAAAELVEKELEGEWLGPKLERLLSTKKGIARLEKLGFKRAVPPAAGAQARHGPSPTLSNSHTAPPPRSDKVDNSPAACRARALARVKQMNGETTTG